MWKEEELRTNMAATQHSTRCCLLPLFTHFIFWMVWVNASAAWLTQSVYSFLLLKLPFLNVNHMLGCTGSLIASRKHHDTVDAHRLWTKHDRWRDEKKKDPVPPGLSEQWPITISLSLSKWKQCVHKCSLLLWNNKAQPSLRAKDSMSAPVSCSLKAASSTTPAFP